MKFFDNVLYNNEEPTAAVVASRLTPGIDGGSIGGGGGGNFGGGNGGVSRSVSIT